jgi:2-methylcitrate dehydratase PrpD
VRLSGFVERMCGGRDLGNLASAQMSLPYALASVLVYGHAGLVSYLAERRKDPRIARAMERITLEIDAAMSDLDEPVVTLEVAGEAPRARQVLVPLGDPTNPVSDALLLEKYRGLASVALNEGARDALANVVFELDELADVRPLAKLLCGDADAHALLR